MNSARNDAALPAPGCPIRKSSDQSSLSSSPKLIAASHALHRLPAPRHSPCALSSLTSVAATINACHVHIGHDSTGYPYAIVKDRNILNPTSMGRIRRGQSLIEHVAIDRGESGADRDRTDDLRLAKPALSQLSYSPPRPAAPQARSDATRWA